MAIAYWCIVVAALLPYVWIAVAKTGAPNYNNKDPRAWLARQESYRVRNANAAHLNAFEAFAPFTAGVLMAQAAGVDPHRITWLAVAFVTLRIVHGLCYLAAIHLLRSLVWVAGFACVLALMAQAALRIVGAG